MARTFDSDDVITRLWEYINKIYNGSQRAFAKAHGIDHANLSRVLSGKKKPGKRILDCCNMRAVIYYEDKD